MSANSRRAIGSRFDDGSSSTRMCGLIASTVAAATRRRWPKLRWWGARSANVSMPTAASASCTRGLELGAAHAEVRGAERHVVVNRRHEELVVGVLEHDPDALADLAEVGLRHGQPADPHLPGAAAEDAVQVQHQGRLAGAVRAEERDPLAFADGEIDAEERAVAVGIGERHPADFECGCGHVSTHASAAMSDAHSGEAQRHQPLPRLGPNDLRAAASNRRSRVRSWRGTRARRARTSG